jgi:Methyltransferase FkbM domain
MSLEFQMAHHHGVSDKITEIDIDSLSLNALFKELSLETVNWLFVDTEGKDYEILINTNFSDLKINTIQFEHTHLNGPHSTGEKHGKLLEHLSSFGFRFINSAGEDTIVSRTL